MEANDMKAMREACTNIVEYAKAAKCHTTDAHILGYLDQIESQAKATLATPPRNCDIGTAEEQDQRFQKFCNKANGGVCLGCPIVAEADCGIVWAQMPYEEGGAK